jgi:hypothetical protein
MDKALGVIIAALIVLSVIAGVGYYAMLIGSRM